jgi:hypothetical protein
MPTYIEEDETGDLLTTEDDELLIVDEETVRVFTITLV